MPRRGGKSRNDWKQSQGSHYSGGGGGSYSDEHDDRDRKPTQRRVSFKPSGFRHGGPLKGRMAEMAIKTHFEDDDIMGGEYSGSGNNSVKQTYRSDKGRRKGSPIPRGGKFGISSCNSRKLLPSTFGWYQVTIPFGQKYAKDEIIRFILSRITPDIFIPHYWRQEKTCIIFFVDDLKIAERLQNLDRIIQMPDGFNLTVKVRSGIPIVNCDEPFKQRMKLVMAKRYNAQTKALDLSRFHTDPDFKDIFCGLFRPVVMSAVIDIIEKNIPDLEALNLNNNQIQQLDSFKNCSQRLPNLKILYLADNRIHAVANLTIFRGAPIVELVLTNNPLRNRYKDHTLYVSEVRRKFPKLLKLDGQNLEPLISFDVLDSTTLPKPIQAFYCNTNEGARIIREFIKEYFQIYDSDSRQPLLAAYHEQAMLSLSCPLASQGGRLSTYWQYNRNLIRANDHDAKFRLLKTGRLPVVSFLSELPKTQHDLMSFSVDLSIFLPTLISFTVAGLFKELSNDTSSSSTSSEIRSFQRHIVIIPAGSGFLIRNEMIIISNATHVQVRNAFKEPQPIHQILQQSSIQDRVQQPNIQPAVTAPVVSASGVVSPDDNTKLQMIQAMSAQSTMNLEWSKKCLEETNWDFANAAFIFNKLHKENKIPAEAFVKNF